MAAAEDLSTQLCSFNYQKWFFKKDKIVDVLIPALAEFVGSAFFIFMACGAGMNTVNMVLFPGTVQVQISLAFGFMITALAFTIGHISGGHLNCAVTFAFVLSGRISGMRGLFYFIGQLFGGIVGALLLKALMPHSFWPSCFAANFLGPEVTPGMAFFTEMILTFFLLFVVSAATDSQKALKDLTPLAIGLCIYCCHMVGIPITGTSINPTRSFASAIVASGMSGCEGVWTYHWIFWVAPIFGGVLATFVYQIAFAQQWGESLVSQYRDDYNEPTYEDQQQYEPEQDQMQEVQAHNFGEQQQQQQQQQSYYDDQHYAQTTPQPAAQTRK